MIDELQRAGLVPIPAGECLFSPEAILTTALFLALAVLIGSLLSKPKE